MKWFDSKIFATVALAIVVVFTVGKLVYASLPAKVQEYVPSALKS